MDNVGKREHLAALFDAAAGPLTWLDHDTATGTIGNTTVRLETHTANIGGGNRVITGGEVSIALDGRTPRVVIDNRARTHPSLPVVLTGDPAFDDLFLIQGWPDQAVRQAFDDDARRWITGRWPDGWPPIRAEAGHLVARFTVFRHDGSDMHDTAMPADGFRQNATALIALADRLTEAYDAERAAVVASHGADAGRAWDASLRANEAELATKRTGVRVAVFGGFALLCALVVAAVAAASGLL